MQSVDLLNDNPHPSRGGDPARARGQPLPVHRLPQHREGRAARRRPDRGGAGMTATQERPRRRDRPRPAAQGGPAADHRPHPLDRQHHPARDAAPGHGAQPVRARDDHQHRHQSAAKAAPNVVDVLTGADLGDEQGVMHQRLADHPRPGRPDAPPMPATGSRSPARSSPSSWPARAAEARDAAELVDVEYEELPGRARPQGGGRRRGARASRPRHQQVGVLGVRLRRGRHRRQRRRGHREGPRRRHRDRAGVPPAAADPGLHGAALGRGRPDR